MYSSNKNGGISIVGLILLAVILILTLNYFHLKLNVSIDSTDASNSANSQRGVLSDIWTKYLEQPVSHLWNDIILKYFWQPFIDGIKEGGPVGGYQNSVNLVPDNSP